MKNIFLISLVMIIITAACDEVIELDIDQVPPVPVIEGNLTNRSDKNYVKITQSVGFYDSTVPPAVTDATVVLTGSNGTTVNFLPYSGENEDSLAYYFPIIPIIGEAGVIYTLDVTIENVLYSATDQMLEVAPIDSLSFIKDPFRDSTEENEGRVYQVLLYSKEPQETKDYYMFQFFRNWERSIPFDNAIFLADDNVLGEIIDGAPTPVSYAKKDSAVVEMYGISREAFVYYTDLQTVLGNDGGMFSPPPANPRNNWNNDALGFFFVSSLTSDTIIINP